MMKKKIIIIEEIIFLANRKRGSNTLKKGKKTKKKITTMKTQVNELLRRDREPLVVMTFSRKSINSHSSINKSMLEGSTQNLIIIIELPDCRCPIVRKYLKGVALRMGTKYGVILGRHYKTLARTIVKNKMQEAWLQWINRISLTANLLILINRASLQLWSMEAMLSVRTK